jgi:hypothetical protein
MGFNSAFQGWIKRAIFGEKKLMGVVFYISATYVWNVSHSKKNSDLIKREPSQQIFDKFSCSKFDENPSVVVV